MNNIYGYCRVSGRNQHEDRQVIAMHDMGVTDENIYIDKQSGKDFNRPKYKRLMKKLKKDDILYIESIDRLGRNYEEIMEQWKYITKYKRADIVVIDMPILDTRRGKDLLGTFIADVVLALLSYVAENERMNIRRRQAEGIAAAKAKGVKFGAPTKPLPDNFDDIYCKWKDKIISSEEAIKESNMPRSTFYSKAKQYEESLCLKK